jgi:hypothetical protein
MEASLPTIRPPVRADAAGVADLSTLFRDAGWPVLLAEPDGRLRDANPAACALLRRSASELEGAPWVSCVDARVAWACAGDHVAEDRAGAAFSRPLASRAASRWARVEVWPAGDTTLLRLTPAGAPEPAPGLRTVAATWRAHALDLVARAADAVAPEMGDLLCLFAVAGEGDADLARLCAASSAGRRVAELTTHVSRLARRDRFVAAPVSPDTLLRELDGLLGAVVGPLGRVQLDVPAGLPRVLVAPAGLTDPILALGLALAASRRPARLAVTVRARSDALQVLIRARRDVVEAARPALAFARAVLAPVGGTLAEAVVTGLEATLDLRVPLLPEAPVLVAHADRRVGVVLASVLRARGWPAAWPGDLAETTAAAGESPVPPVAVIADTDAPSVAGVPVVRFRAPTPRDPAGAYALAALTARLRRFSPPTLMPMPA